MPRHPDCFKPWCGLEGKPCVDCANYNPKPQLRGSLDMFDKVGQVGDWCILNGAPGTPYERNRYIAIRLTAADDGVCVLPIVTQGDYADPARAKTDWYWDGNREAPTLEPSILHHSTPEWHGWMRAGVLVSA